MLNAKNANLLIILLALTYAVAACGDDGADNSLASDAIALTPIDAEFIAPESAHWDAEGQRWYVSSFGQNFDLTGQTPDAPATIAQLGPDGAVIDRNFVELPEGDVLGISTMDGVLYAAHSSGQLVEVNLDSGETNFIPVPGAGFLNDVATGGGQVYISDTVQNVIHRYTPGEGVEVFSDDPALVAPNGLLVDGDTVVVSNLGSFPPDGTPSGVFTLNAQGDATRIGEIEGVWDGIGKVDGQYLLSDINGTLFLLDPDGTSTMVANLSEAPHNLSSTADLDIDPQSGTIVVPDLLGNQVFRFTLPR